jgi:hypothetical protein
MPAETLLSTMFSTSIVIPAQLSVNFQARVFHNEMSVEVWKVQKEPDVKMRVGQPLWFVSEILVKEVVDCEGKPAKWPRLYEGEIQGVVGWQKNWVQFEVMATGREDFHLWVPLEWSALGLVHRVQHFWQRYWLVDNIPPIPVVTGVRNRRLATSKAIRVRRVLEVVDVDNEAAVVE